MDGALLGLIAVGAALALSSSSASPAAVYRSTRGAIDLGDPPWRYALVPRCVAQNLSSWPAGMWSTHITGRYPIGKVADWLRSLGADPLDYLKIVPHGFGAHLHAPYEDESGSAFALSFTVPDDLLDRWKRANPPPADLDELADIWGVPRWSLDALIYQVILPAMMQQGINGSVIEAISQYWPPVARVRTDELTSIRGLALQPGAELGLSVWPPLQFRDQVHLDAWFAHHQSWRYGWDPGSDYFQVHLEGAEHIAIRAAAAEAEALPPGNPVAQLYARSVALWPLAGDTEEYRRPSPFGDQREPQRRLLLDGSINANAFAAYVLTCAQLGYYFNGDLRFPQAKNAWYAKSVSAGDVVGTLASIVTSVRSAMAGNLAGAFSGAAQTVLGNVMKGWYDTAKSGTWPWHEDWAPVVLRLEQLGVNSPLTAPERAERSAGLEGLQLQPLAGAVVVR